jgi:hypothetical protein
MKYTILVLTLILAAFSTVANASSVGLICTNQSEETLRLFKVNLANKRSSFFSYADSEWKQIYSTDVSIDEISFRDVLLSDLIKISRVTLEWEGRVDIDFKKSKNMYKGSCATKKFEQMNDIAKRELDKLNNKRAF